MSQAISQPVGTNVRVYLNKLKGVMSKRGKRKGKVISFTGKVHEIKNDYLIIKGMFIHNIKVERFPQLCCRKFHLSEIMRVVTIEEVKN